MGNSLGQNGSSSGSLRRLHSLGLQSSEGLTEAGGSISKMSHCYGCLLGLIVSRDAYEMAVELRENDGERNQDRRLSAVSLHLTHSDVPFSSV